MLDIISRSIHHVNNNVKLQSFVRQFKFVRSCESRSLEKGNNNEAMTNIIVTMDMRPLNPRGLVAMAISVLQAQLTRTPSSSTMTTWASTRKDDTSTKKTSNPTPLSLHPHANGDTTLRSEALSR